MANGEWPMANSHLPLLLPIRHSPFAIRAKVAL
jgi:hypothetical protein